MQQSAPAHVDQPLSTSAEYPTLQTPTFGAELRARREAAGFSQAALARRAGIARGTIRNIEEGRTDPSPETLRRLQQVASLHLSADPTAPEGAWTPAAHYAPSYAPLSLAADMVAACNAQGGALDQAFLYLDLQGAADWLRYANDGVYVANFRQRLPLEEMARRILKGYSGHGLDVVALGVGDGKDETRLAQHLAALLPAPPDLRLYVVDISHGLLHAAFTHAVDTLGSARVAVLPVHGDFYGLPRYPVLAYRPDGDRRARCWVLLGGTTQNLRDEVAFFRDLHSISRPGDYVLLQAQGGYAAAHDLKAVRAADPALTRSIAAPVERWVTGPLRRHCVGLANVTLRAEVSNHCPVPGSYEIHLQGDVLLASGARRAVLCWRAKRYDPTQLAAAMRDIGWREVSTLQYGLSIPGPFAMLLRRS